LFSKTVSDNFSKLEFFERENQDYQYYEGENKIKIPKIEIEALLLLSDNPDEKEIEKLLDFGVVLFPGSVLPGEPGQTVILGHSAPLGWPKIKYEWVFSRLNELLEGDEIHLFLNNKRYRYKVSEQIFLDIGDEIPQALTSSKNMLVLVTCWPPGKDQRRMAITAELF
jgi:LPXTG-site transpeptidase (sortase) family protein